MGRLGKNLSVEEARKKVHVKGFRNFLAVDPKNIGLHILQFCAQHYLCRPGQNYYLTDVSKGAMKGKQADHQRQERYRLWYPLLRKELALIGPQARLIAVGRVVDEFLRDQGIVPAASILHYSGQNVSWRQRAVAPYADDFAKYRDAVTMSAILEAAADYAQGTEVPAGSAAEFLAEVTARQEQLSREGRTYPTVSQQQLMFHYKHEFAALQSTGCRGN